MMNFYQYHTEVLDEYEKYSEALTVYTKTFGTPLCRKDMHLFTPIKHLIKTVPYYACIYAVDVVGGRWVEAEEYIKKDSYCWAVYEYWCK
jgi:hypothetical protein